jgi:hypothetical protein
MLQVASITPAIKSRKEVRAPGAMEHLFWLMDQKHPALLTVTAEVKGFTKVRNWRDALEAVQRRHPILSTSIRRNEEGRPALYQVDAAPIALRVVDGSVRDVGSWSWTARWRFRSPQSNHLLSGACSSISLSLLFSSGSLIMLSLTEWCSSS